MKRQMHLIAIGLISLSSNAAAANPDTYIACYGTLSDYRPQVFNVKITYNIAIDFDSHVVLIANQSYPIVSITEDRIGFQSNSTVDGNNSVFSGSINRLTGETSVMQLTPQGDKAFWSAKLLCLPKKKLF